jgi:hypothetical protein
MRRVASEDPVAIEALSDDGFGDLQFCAWRPELAFATRRIRAVGAYGESRRIGPARLVRVDGLAAFGAAVHFGGCERGDGCDENRGGGAPRANRTALSVETRRERPVRRHLLSFASSSRDVQDS